MQPYSSRLRRRASGLRVCQTDAEAALWRGLRRKQMLGLRFYRQRPIYSYIVDFYCPAANLVIEIDGGQHFDTAEAEYDRRRTRRLISAGLEVLRFDNRQALTETDAVLEAIRQVVTERL